MMTKNVKLYAMMALAGGTVLGQQAHLFDQYEPWNHVLGTVALLVVAIAGVLVRREEP